MSKNTSNQVNGSESQPEALPAVPDYTIVDGVKLDQFLRQTVELVKSRAAGDLVHIVERLACCTTLHEKSAVCVVYYRGLPIRRAAAVLGITDNQVKDALASAGRRYQALTTTRQREAEIMKRDRSLAKRRSQGVEMTLQELSKAD